MKLKSISTNHTRRNFLLSNFILGSLPNLAGKLNKKHINYDYNSLGIPLRVHCESHKSCNFFRYSVLARNNEAKCSIQRNETHEIQMHPRNSL